MEAYRALVPAAFEVLGPGGWLVLETGAGQHQMVTIVLQDAGMVDIAGMLDLDGHERMIVARKPA